MGKEEMEGKFGREGERKRYSSLTKANSDKFN